MAVTKVDARGWTFEIEVPGSPAVWTEIGGITTFSWTSNDQTTDTTDFDSDGIEESQAMQRGKALTLTGFFKEDLANKARDAGQAAVEAAAEEVGEDSLYSFRMESPGGTVYTQTGHFTMADNGGGGNNDKTSWSTTFTRSGKTTKS